MAHDAENGPPPRTFGQRIQQARERRGLTRPVLAGLVGRSTEWVKSIETGRRGMPRYPLLLRLAEALGTDDLSSLTGDERVTLAAYTKAAHPKLVRVKDALISYELTREQEPVAASVLADRVREAWRSWHGFGEHRSRVAELLPGLLADLQYGARVHEGSERRRTLICLAQAYHLAQLYLSFQPAPELIMLAGDRSMTAAQDADSPRAIAAAAWYLNHVFRDAGEAHEARVDLAMRAAGLLHPDRGPEDIALSGLLHLAAALSYAKVGPKGSAEHHFDKANEAARRLPGYVHPWLMFGQGMVDAYAITMNTDLVRVGAAVDAATHVDLATMPSATRRSFHIIETARALRLKGEVLSVLHLVGKAYEASPETARFNFFARSTVLELSQDDSALVREDARGLARRLGVAA